jgi:hypothetical protein
MTDTLSLRPLNSAHESYATVYEHPEFGKIDVGRINERSGQKRALALSIGIVAKPGLSHAATGSAPTQKAAIAAWKTHWPKFRDARSEGEWHDPKAAQERARKACHRWR